jgi:endonuclease/exonuclease/phosphatase family metal-dependent hydrolase
MRVLASLSLSVALGTGLPATTARQNGVQLAQAARSPFRVSVETSELLTHSSLTACSVDQAPIVSTPKRSRVATWNIRAARSAPVDAIGAELRAMQVDVVALQEVDVRVRRTGFVDQPAALATSLGLNYVFAASIKWDGGDYGLALLSRSPLTEVRRHRLDPSAAAEPRIVLEVTVCVEGRPLRIFNHHADGRVASRNAAFEALRAIVQPHVGHGILVLGYFNDHSDARGVHRLIDIGLVDLGADLDMKTADNGRIDYILADRPLSRRAASVRVWPTDKSDHNAVSVDLAW